MFRKKLILSRPRGFCAGVERAIDTVERALQKFGPPIYVKHEIVHNRHVVERLASLGAIFVEEIAEIPDHSIVIYSAHGIPPSVRKEAEKKNLKQIDATCGLVTRVHSAAKRYQEKGYHILLIGHKTHVEIIGTAGEVEGNVTIIESVEDVASLTFAEEQKLFYVTQTTLSLDDVKEITEALEAKYPHVQTLPSSSICYATTNRQMALRQIASDVDLVLVVGDPKSSNSNRLREVAENRGVKAYLINSASEIDPVWIDPVKMIGLTAGASTPEEIVQDCIARLFTLGVEDKEEVTLVEENVVFGLPKEVLSV